MPVVSIRTGGREFLIACEDVAWYLEGEPGGPTRRFAPGADLRGTDLRGARLAAEDLREANLEGADLRGADLRYAWLSGWGGQPATLQGAALEGAVLRSAVMPYVNLRGASLKAADLRYSYLCDADLSGADLEGALMDYLQTGDARYAGARLVSARMRHAMLGGVFHEADLTGADLTGAHLGGADLRGACLRDADLTGAYLRRADLTGADLRGTHLTGVRWDDSTRWPADYKPPLGEAQGHREWTRGPTDASGDLDLLEGSTLRWWRQQISHACFSLEVRDLPHGRAELRFSGASYVDLPAVMHRVHVRKGTVEEAETVHSRLPDGWHVEHVSPEDLFVFDCEEGTYFLWSAPTLGGSWLVWADEPGCMALEHLGRPLWPGGPSLEEM